MSALVAGLCTMVDVRGAAAEDWSAPYCGEQPRITAVFDHDLPRYRRNGRLLLFSGDDIADCPDTNRPSLRLGYDGHSGWDFTRMGQVQGCGVGHRAGQGQSLVYAAAEGLVRRSRWYHRTLHDRSDGPASAFGLHIELDHGEGEGSIYGHLSAVFVEEGQAVARGQLIGGLGTTGNSTGPHLHWQAGKKGQVSSSYFSFDPYGWDRRFGPGDPVPPDFVDPHHGTGWSERRIVPGARGPVCPQFCGVEIVDDASPDVVFHCPSVGGAAGGAACPAWTWDARGFQDGHHYVRPRSGVADHFADYHCSHCPAGAYLVKAWVPFGRDIADTHVARYEVGQAVTLLDQHSEGGLWQNLGIFVFEGRPMVRLTNRGDRYDYHAPVTQKIAADALMFHRLCFAPPPGTPVIPPSWGKQVLR